MTSVTLRPVTAEEYDALRAPGLEEFTADLARAEHRTVDAALRTRAESFYPETLDAALDVAGDHRRQGLGRAAMVAAEDLLRADGCTRIALNVFGWNDGAAELYRTLGFEVDSTQLSKSLAAVTGEEP